MLPGSTARKLNGAAKQLVVRLLAEYEKPAAIRAAVKEHFGIEISREAVYFYAKHPKWRAIIEEKRKALETEIDRLPISSRFWRMRQRQQILAQARHQDKPDLGTARGLLTDAAREMGQLQPEESSTPHIGSINLTLVNQVLQMPENVQEEYLRTGRLPPGSYLSDLPVVEDEKDGNSPG